MENVEIQSNRSKAHDCNLCPFCQASIEKEGSNKCTACQFTFFEKLYENFSSGHKVVDEIIKNPIYTKYGGLNYYEWIPWDHLSNIKEIARGGFGIIYKANVIDGLIDVYSIEHYGAIYYERKKFDYMGREVEEMEVAIKFLMNSEEVLKELNIQRAMFYKNSTQLLKISSIYGITQNPETLEYGIVMKFAKHGDMRKFISKNFHSTSWKNKLEIAYDIANGLYSIHSSGMVHRDLHSGNILQLDIKYVQIGDLGLCQPVNHKATTTEEKKGIFGVIPYIPPEVLRGEKFTAAGDIYSFAMLLWELATGKPPFHNCSHDHSLMLDISFNGARPEITSPLIPPCIAEIIEKCWDDNPLNRPTAKELENNLWELWNMYRLLNQESKTENPKMFQLLESENYIKKIAKGDDSTTDNLTTITSIHSGAVYKSRLLTLEIIDLSNEELTYFSDEETFNLRK
ncbi:hypothetical protein G9A89_014829 [Geosiphon pyriformis]|nr:hypothetical protein G9A89_014829 [Geosiphon pyriformis]